MKPTSNKPAPEPGQDLLSYTFHGESACDGTEPIYVDAEDPSRSLSAAQTKRLVRRCIAGWKACGLHKGEAVLVVLANSILYSSVYFSIIGAGGVYFGGNPSNTELELDHLMNLGEPRHIVTSSQARQKVLGVAKKNGVPRQNVYVLESKTFPLSAGAYPSPLGSPKSKRSELLEDTGCRDFVDLTTYGESDWMCLHDEQLARSTPAAMFCTSGTSGPPKAAVLSHFAVVSQNRSIEPPSHYAIRRLLSLPFFHVLAALYAHVFPVRLGQPVYILPRFQMEQVAKAIQDFGITDTVMAPPMVHTLNQARVPLHEMLRTIRWVGVGGAPIAVEAMHLLHSRLDPSATVSQVWGMTEFGAATTFHYPEHEDAASIGRPLPGYEMRLVDASDTVVAGDRVQGEIQVLYPGTMTGYKNMKPVTEGAWFSTGDVAECIDGKYYVIARSKELIKVNGFQVAPAELEALLMVHPRVLDAAVVGVFRPDGVTEVPRAYVVPKNKPRSKALSSEDVYDFARERLVSYKALNGGVKLVDSIPRTASGKIQRFKLKEMDQQVQRSVEIQPLYKVAKRRQPQKPQGRKSTPAFQASRLRRSQRIALNSKGPQK